MTGPAQPLGMSDFFALEAGEYLERLDGLLAQGDHASADELVRLARALRGSALMANQPAIARAAAGLESLARAVRESRRTWDPPAKQLAVRAVDDLKIFVRRAGSWTEADTAKAEALGQELDQLAGRPSAQIRAVEALGLDAGARAFVAREGAAIASALDRAAQALRANSTGPDPLQHVLRALQPLRGLAALADRAPGAHRRAVSDGDDGHRPRGARGGRARPARPRRRRVPEVRGAAGPLDGERAGRRVDRVALLQRLRTAPRVPRRAGSAPVHTGAAGAGEPRGAPAAGCRLARARPERHPAGVASPHAGEHVPRAGKCRRRHPR